MSAHHAPRDDPSVQAATTGVSHHAPSTSISSTISSSRTLTGDVEAEAKEIYGRWSTSSSSSSQLQKEALTEIYHDPEPESPPVPEKPAKKVTASWSQLPRKEQLALLTIARLSEPLTQTSLQSYMYYQLKSFDPSLPDSVISSQAGMMQASFTAAQFLTAMAWGRAADSEKFGRKNVIMIGLLGTMVSALGFGFASTFWTAMIFRSIGGALNGNVGVMRTMISEIIKEKKYQSRAFMVLPMTFNVGVIIGPMLGGLLSDPVGQYPGIFGPGSLIGGENGVWWMTRWPYALPNLVSAMFLIISTTALFLGLDETHHALQERPDRGKQLGRWLWRTISRKSSQNYASLPTDEPGELGSAHNDIELQPRKKKPISRRKLPFRRIWTRNVVFTMFAQGLMAIHVGTFNNLWFLFLSTPRFDPANPYPPGHIQSPPFHFTGGLAMPPARIGLALSILGAIGIVIQLFVYPRVSARLGTERSYRYALLLFPVAYFIAPYLALLPSSTAPPAAANGVWIWGGITVVLAVQVLARTFALPAMVILVNNSCPHPSVLGTLHGVGQSVSSGMRTIGPAVAATLYGRGIEWGVIGTGYWFLGIIAISNNFAGMFVREGSGHEIVLDGEEEEEAEGMLPVPVEEERGRKR
ncbi:MFS general substrate transporter [Trichodelitschia bisporula]|uniref:MFS general substrate transporter n=1 Tax=Trichodelitschia bisporula TaxID=703511 RepID=A0A6G1HRC2_9PEZI|nr:MFS general substrate transporter [Trichodelitschia bisporula]